MSEIAEAIVDAVLIRDRRIAELEAALVYVVGDLEAMHGEVLRNGSVPPATAREVENLNKARALIKHVQIES